MFLSPGGPHTDILSKPSHVFNFRGDVRDGKTLLSNFPVVSVYHAEFQYESQNRMFPVIIVYSGIRTPQLSGVIDVAWGIY